MSSTKGTPAEAAREHLIESHLPLVRAVARRYAGRGAELDDLLQVGALGLIKATDRFDPRRGVAFASFAAPTIEGEIRHHLRDRTSSLRIPRELQAMSGKLRRCRDELAAALGRAPTVQELADALAADERDVEQALAAERARDPIPISPDEDDAVGVKDSSEPLAGSDDRLLMADTLRVLDERERRIVLLRFHADMTERQIASELGISQAHVSRLLGGALVKLRDELANSSDAAGEGDTTAGAVISPTAARARSLKTSRTGDQSRAKARERTTAPNTRIARVGAPHEKPSLGRYLELPYHIAVRADRDGERSWWSATVEELPGCSAQGSTPDEAVQLLRPRMEAWLAAALAEDREIPVPSPEASKQKTTPSYSGRFLVRMPSALHEQLASAAERDQVSLNRFVTDVLAASVSPGPMDQRPQPGQEPVPAVEPTPSSQPRPARGIRVALATNLVVVALAGLVAVVLLVLALQRGI